MEGGKGMLWVAIKKVCANKRLFVRKKAVFADSKKWFKQAVFCLRKREAFESKA